MSYLTEATVVEKAVLLQHEAKKVATQVLNDEMSIAEAARFLADIAERLEALK